MRECTLTKLVKEKKDNGIGYYRNGIGNYDYKIFRVYTGGSKFKRQRYDDERGVNTKHMRTKRNRWPWKKHAD